MAGSGPFRLDGPRPARLLCQIFRTCTPSGPVPPKSQAPATQDAAKGAKPLTYRDAGVDIDAGNALVKAIGPLAAKTMRAGVLGGIGGFGGLFDLKACGF